jgi:hypothetical protein
MSERGNSFRSVNSYHSAYSDAAVEGIMKSQPIAPKLSRLSAQEKHDLLSSPRLTPVIQK